MSVGSSRRMDGRVRSMSPDRVRMVTAAASFESLDILDRRCVAARHLAVPCFPGGSQLAAGCHFLSYVPLAWSAGYGFGSQS